MLQHLLTQDFFTKINVEFSFFLALYINDVLQILKNERIIHNIVQKWG